MLVCPACDESLSPDFRCAGCGQAYPVEEGIPYLVPPGVSVDGYDASLFDLIEAIETRHFWFHARNDLIMNAVRPYLPRGQPRVLEVGCGTGAVLARFVANGIAAEGGDLFREALRRCRDRLNVPLWQVDARRLPFIEEFDAVGLFDCLEHVDDEGAVLSGVYRSLRPAGLVMITVPALPSLWSHIDELSHHRCRYSRAALVRAVERAGFAVLRATYFNALLVLPLWLQRRVFHRRTRERTWASPSAELLHALRVPPRLINTLVQRLLAVEGRWIEQRRNLPLGASLLLIARRPTQKVERSGGFG